MKNSKFLYIIIISIFTFNSYGQKGKIARADKKYDNYAYIDAIKTYEKVASKGYKSADMFQKLGNAYYFNSEFDKATKWYDQLFLLNVEVDSEYYYRYAQSLKSSDQSEKANEMIAKFEEKSGNDSRAKLFKKEISYRDMIMENSGRFTIEDAGINTKYSDYGSALYNKKLVFTSARDTGSLGQRKHSWTGQYFTNLYESDLTEDLIPGVPVKFNDEINSKFHESSAIFTKDGQTMYFTRNNYLAGKKGKDTNNITLVKIFKASLQNNKWTNIVELSINSNNYSTAHPALSPDEKTLYFVSDMPGSLGDSDLFKAKINADGTFGIAENLGSKINSAGKETFPFVSDENELYFASDIQPGLGGLDIFVSKINADGSFENVQNIGAEANSPRDDFAYFIDSKSRRGFFTSNRDGGKGFDDIYKFLETKKLQCDQEIYGEITDLLTSLLLPDAKITLFDNEFKILNVSNSDQNGKYSFKVDCNKTYTVRAEKPEYATNEKTITTDKNTGRTHLPIPLEKTICKVAVGDDLGKCFGIKFIYFDLNKADIKPEAALDLEKILDVLNQNPTMKIDIRSFTDSRASLQYNQALSDRRAKSTINWLITNGIAADRLTGKGYGETQILNKCTDTIPCTEEEHQLNRRSEFIITAI